MAHFFGESKNSALRAFFVIVPLVIDYIRQWGPEREQHTTNLSNAVRSYGFSTDSGFFGSVLDFFGSSQSVFCGPNGTMA